MTTLYAWATPAFSKDSPVDHTFVTDYDNRVDDYPSIEKVEQAQANYWYCWGIFHAQGDSSQQPNGYLGSASGDFALAQCLCLPNKASDSIDPHIRPNACGTIYHYGLDGVCHQLANQVLNIEQERNVLKKKYYDRMKEGVGALTAARFLQVENQLERLVDLQIAAQLPVMDQK